jgi:hypothetical protein
MEEENRLLFSPHRGESMSKARIWLGVLLVAAVGCLLFLWYSRDASVVVASSDASIVVSNIRERHHGVTVENGEAYDRAAIEIEDYKKVILPDSAEVRREGKDNKIQVFLKKHMHFGGYPPESMSIRTERKNMGCAVKDEDGGSVVLATFGEWSCIEGGAAIALLVLVPEGIAVEQRSGLSGELSAGREWHGQYLTKPKNVQEGWWYGPASPAEGWKAIPDVPDRGRHAAGTNYPPFQPIPPAIPKREREK